MKGTVILILFLGAAFSVYAEDVLLGDVDVSQGDVYSERRVNVAPDESFPRLNEDLTVKLKTTATLFSRMEYVNTPGSKPWLWPPSVWRSTCKRTSDQPALEGKVLYVSGSTVAVEVNQEPGFCGSYFNADSDEKRVAFVNIHDIAERSAVVPGCAGQSKGLQALARLTMACKVPEPVAPLPKKLNEIEDYMKCYRTKKYNDYTTFYKDAVELAAGTFQVSFVRAGEKTKDNTKSEPIKIPILDLERDYQKVKPTPALVKMDPTALKCLGLRESTWDNNSVSPTGARGLMQQTSIAVRETHCLLNGCDSLKRKPETWARALWTEFMKKAQSSSKPEVWDKLTSYMKPVCDDKSKSQDKSCGDAHSPTDFVKVRCKFNIEDFSPEDPRVIDASTGGPKVRDPDPHCPINSIASAALEVVDIEIKLRSATPLYPRSDVADFSDAQQFQLQMIMALAHNSGPSAAVASVLNSNKPEDWPRAISKMIDDKSRVGEIQSNYEALNNCMTKGNFKPPADEPDQSKTCPEFKNSH